MAVPFDPEQVIARELMPGERLLWSGQPRRAVRFQGATVFHICFSLLVAGVAMYRLTQAIGSGAPALLIGWRIVFLAIALGFVASWFVAHAWRRGRTAYGLTDQRAIIIEPKIRGGHEMKCMPLRTLGNADLSENPDGSGTITLGDRVPPAGWPGCGP
jgi:hypothetical protein